MDDRVPPGEDEEGLHGHDSHADQLVVGGEAEDGEEDADEDGELKETKDHEPGEEEEAESFRSTDDEADRGKK